MVADQVGKMKLTSSSRPDRLIMHWFFSLQYSRKKMFLRYLYIWTCNVKIFSEYFVLFFLYCNSVIYCTVSEKRSSNSVAVNRKQTQDKDMILLFRIYFHMPIGWFICNGFIFRDFTIYLRIKTTYSFSLASMEIGANVSDIFNFVQVEHCL